MTEQDQATSQSGDSHDPNKADSAFSSQDSKQNGPLHEVRRSITNERDIGLEETDQQTLEKSKTAGSNTSQRDPKVITWEGPDDPENPKNWPNKTKWTTMTIVALFTLISPVSSTMIAPALKYIAADFDIKDEFTSQLTLSIFILAYAVGPLFLGPLSETYGRAIVLQLANLFYLVFNIACGVCQSKGQLIAFRFLSGLGGSVPLAVGGGVIGDTFRAEERGTAMAVYSLAPLLGPAIGPIVGGLNYISLGLGALLGANICVYLNDRTYRHLKTRHNDIGRPEFRLPLLAITSICVPAGLFIYGWTAQTHQHWIAPNIGACLFGIGNMMTFQCMQTYIVDTYTLYAASAMAAVSVLRCLTAFGFPLFAPYMYNTLHYGWGNSLLAFISIGIGVPAPIFLWKFGEKLRKASPYAAG